jgi:hypothetical protein
MKKHLIAIGLFFLIYAPVALLVIVGGGCFHENNQEVLSQSTASNFKVIFQNENEMGTVRASSGTCQDTPEGTLIIDDQGEGWLVSDDLTEGTNVIMLLTDNNTNEYNDDSIITLIEVVQ